MRINHNISALTALHQLNSTDSKLETSLERLSSGLRINSAADDAAGLAITQKMNTQIRGLDQADRNAMDGISLIQTAEGALGEVQDMLQRIRELAVEASNDTYDDSDRETIQAEVDELLEEIDRISEDTEFNEITLLNGDMDRRSYSSNTDIASIITMSDSVDPGAYSIDVTGAATQTTGTSGTASLFGGVSASTLEGTININGEEVEISIGDTGEEVFEAIRDACSAANISLTSSTSAYDDGSTLTLTADAYGPETIEVTGDPALLAALGLDTSSFVPTTGLDATVDTSTLSGFPTGTTVTVDGQSIIIDGDDDFQLELSGGTSTGTVTINILETGPLDLQIGANQGQTMEVRIPDSSAEALGIADIDLTTTDNASDALDIIDAAIDTVSATRSKLGAYQNRLEYTSSNLTTASENMTAAYSRILDVDMAEEMSTYTQQSVIQQAGTSMLAQANQRPQSILQLLE
jgi:flagellin